MGIYISGMEMPKPGQIILVEIDENGDVFAAYDGGRTKLTQHKAVPVPEHGDLIDKHDAQKLIYQGMPTMSLADAMSRLIFDAPTIIRADPADKEEG